MSFNVHDSRSGAPLRSSLITKRTCPTTPRWRTAPARGVGLCGEVVRVRRLGGAHPFGRANCFRRAAATGVVWTGAPRAVRFGHPCPPRLARQRSRWVVPRQVRPRGRQPQEFQVYLHLLQPRHEQKALHGLDPPARAPRVCGLWSRATSFYWHSHEDTTRSWPTSDRGRQRLCPLRGHSRGRHDLRAVRRAQSERHHPPVSLPPARVCSSSALGRTPIQTSPTSTTGCSATNCTTAPRAATLCLTTPRAQMRREPLSTLAWDLRSRPTGTRGGPSCGTSRRSSRASAGRAWSASRARSLINRAQEREERIAADPVRKCAARAPSRRSRASWRWASIPHRSVSACRPCVSRFFLFIKRSHFTHYTPKMPHNSAHRRRASAHACTGARAGTSCFSSQEPPADAGAPPHRGHRQGVAQREPGRVEDPLHLCRLARERAEERVRSLGHNVRACASQRLSRDGIGG